ncbi:TolC family protein, partial [Herbaspirillum sp. alder98]|uniref:TolC family protein n=1 Tax=Herbaspirillum sp. alder98 TaxID=2913096 RepID=UPI001CD87D0D
RAEVARAGAAFLPRIEASWSRSHTTAATDGRPSQHSAAREWRIALTQPLFDWALWSHRQLADVRRARQSLMAAQARQQLRMQVVERYFAALAARDELALDLEAHAVLQAQQVSTLARREAGEATLIDLHELQAELARSSHAVSDARTRAQLRLQQVQDMLGHPVQGLAGLPEQQALPGLFPDDLTAWIAQAGSSNFDIQLARLDQRIAALEGSRALGDYLPRAMFKASHGRQDGGAAPPGRPPTRSSAIGVQLTIPLFSGIEGNYRRRQTLALEEQAAHELEAARRKTLAAVHESHALAQQGRRSIAELDAFVTAAARALEATRIGYRIGNRREIDLIRTQATLRGARRDRLRARYDALLHSLRLKALTASLTHADIEAINQLLQPD